MSRRLQERRQKNSASEVSIGMMEEHLTTMLKSARITGISNVLADEVAAIRMEGCKNASIDE